MIPLGMILLATAPDQPTKSFVSVEDYPAAAQAEGAQGEVVADLLINPSGGVETCSIVLSSGFAVLDQATCALLQKRARFTPGKDATGRAEYDLFRTPPIIWSLGSFRGFPVPPDYDLMINRAPDGVRLPLEFTVDYLVTRDGKSLNCELSPAKSAPKELVDIACQSLASAPPEIIRDRNGLPVEARNHADFRFSLDKVHTK